MGSPASQAGPGPDSDEGSGPGSGVLGEQRDGVRQGWGPDCHRTVAEVGVFALGPITCFKALSGLVTQSFPERPRSSVKDHLVGHPLPLPTR